MQEGLALRNVAAVGGVLGAALGAAIFLPSFPPDEATPMIFITAMQCGLAGQVYSIALREEADNQSVKWRVLVAFAMTQLLASIQGEFGGQMAAVEGTPETLKELLFSGIRCLTVVQATMSALDFAWRQKFLEPYGQASKRVRREAEEKLLALQAKQRQEEGAQQVMKQLSNLEHEQAALHEDMQ